MRRSAACATTAASAAATRVEDISFMGFKMPGATLIVKPVSGAGRWTGLVVVEVVVEFDGVACLAFEGEAVGRAHNLPRPRAVYFVAILGHADAAVRRLRNYSGQRRRDES